MDYPTIQITKIQPHPQNPRNHTEEQIGKIARSIKELGWGRPIIVSIDHYILAGHGAYMAAQEIGCDMVPVKYMPYRHDEPEALAYMVADNKLTDESDWNYAKLEGAFDDIKLSGFDVELTGFPETELQLFTEQVHGPTEVVEDDPIDEDAVEATVQPGDIWQLGRHRLMCGDSTKEEDVERLMDGALADMVFTDPPYGINIVSTNKTIGFGGELGFVGGGGIVPANKYPKIIGDDTTKTAEDHYNLCKKLGIKNYVLFGGNYFTEFLPPSACWIIWDKREGIPSNNFSDCEIAWTSFDSPSRIYRHLWSGLLRRGDRKLEGLNRMHPTQKPVTLISDILQNNNFNIIFDGFGGSGSTLIACQQLNRTCHMMELDPHYCDVIITRWETFTGEKAQLIT